MVVKKHLLIAITFLFIGICLIAQNVRRGLYCVSKNGNIPISDVLLHNADFSFTAVSNESGFISIQSIAETQEPLWLSIVGFQTYKLYLHQLNYSNGIAFIYLEPKLTSLADVVVRSASNGGVFKTISDMDIHVRPIANSQEVLRIVPGLFIGQHAGGGKAEQIFLRGFDVDHGTDIHISVDGIPVNMVSHAHGQGYADLHFVIPELIEKVNFNKGPYSTDKGNFGTAGFVSFKTHNYLEKNFIKTELGQFQTSRILAAAELLSSKSHQNKQHFYVATEAAYSNGYFDNPQHFNRLNLQAKYSSQPNQRTFITATISAFSSKWNASGQIPNRAVEQGIIGFFGAIDSNEGGNTDRINASLEHSIYCSNGATWKNQLFVSNYHFQLFSNFTFFKEDPINGDQIKQKEKRILLGYLSSYQKEHYFLSKAAQYTFGWQIRFDNIHNSELSRTLNRTIITSPMMLGNILETNAAMFLQEKWQINRKVELISGIRIDNFFNKYFNLLQNNKYQSSSTIISPKLNLHYRINKSLQLYCYNGKGFHSNDTRVIQQQMNLKVVTPAYGTDIGFILKPSSTLLLQSAFWHLWMQQEFIYVGDEGIVEPGGKTRRWGFDASLRYEFLPNWYADADVNWAHPRALNVPKTNAFLPLAPIITSVGGITYKKTNGWNGSLRYRFMGKRPANENYSVIAKGYCVLDAAINCTHKKWELGLYVQNILNIKWKETQFDTESRLQNEALPISEIHFTAGTPFFARTSVTYYF